MTGGTYDGNPVYLWSGPGAFSNTGATSPVWTRPQVAFNSFQTVELQVTVTGSDGIANAGTTDQATDDVQAIVFNVVAPPAVLPVELPALTGGMGSLATIAVTLVTVAALPIQLPALTGGTGALAAPAVTLVAAPVLLTLSDIAIPSGRRLIGTTQGSLLRISFQHSGRYVC